ncbi:four helix bundle protein [candidate division WOR-3 bacterium]|nr:four helix bundle protein [candidate division WOR-3 bacterium]
MKEDFYKIEDLEVWKEGRRLRRDISKLAKKFPEREKFKLVDQMLRASRSVTANLAEGYGRFHYQENIQFCRQARGSLYEVFDHLTVALDEEYLEESIFEEYKKRIFNIIKLINGYIKYLKTKKDSDNSS